MKYLVSIRKTDKKEKKYFSTWFFAEINDNLSVNHAYSSLVDYIKIHIKDVLNIDLKLTVDMMEVDDDYLCYTEGKESDKMLEIVVAELDEEDDENDFVNIVYFSNDYDFTLSTVTLKINAGKGSNILNKSLKVLATYSEFRKKLTKNKIKELLPVLIDGVLALDFNKRNTISLKDVDLNITTESLKKYLILG